MSSQATSSLLSQSQMNGLKSSSKFKVATNSVHEPIPTGTVYSKSCSVYIGPTVAILFLSVVDIAFMLYNGKFTAEHVHIAVVILSQVLFVLVITFLLFISCTDPGKLPTGQDQGLKCKQKENGMF